MSSGPRATDPRVISAFQSSLAAEGLVALAVLAAVIVVWQLLRTRQLRAALAGELPARVEASHEAPGRRLLRIGFGSLFVFDGLLQTQPAIPEGLVRHVIRPVVVASPAFVRSVVSVGTAVWSHHPVTAAAASVFIQVGIGLLLLVAPRGGWSRLAGVLGAVWALLVWLFAEGLGGIFVSGTSLLFGFPGAALFYVAAGAVVALPEAFFVGEQLGRRLLRGLGLFLLAAAILQALPGRGFWRGGAHNAISLMARQMASVPQPSGFSSVVGSFSSFVAAHGPAVNLVAVVVLVAAGLLLVLPGRRAARAGMIVLSLFSLATWLLVQDLGFFGGLGTDPNSMVPLLLLAAGGYLSLTRPQRAEVHHAPEPVRGLRSWLERAALEQPGFVLQATAAAGACMVICIGVVPMLLATVSAATGAPLNGQLASW